MKLVVVGYSKAGRTTELLYIDGRKIDCIYTQDSSIIVLVNGHHFEIEDNDSKHKVMNYFNGGDE